MVQLYDQRNPHIIILFLMFMDSFTGQESLFTSSECDLFCLGCLAITFFMADPIQPPSSPPTLQSTSSHIFRLLHLALSSNHGHDQASFSNHCLTHNSLQSIYRSTSWDSACISFKELSLKVIQMLACWDDFSPKKPSIFIHFYQN